MDWFGQNVTGRAPGFTSAKGGTVTASVRLEKLGLSAERPTSENAVQGKVVARTFLGSRMAVDVAVDQSQGAILRAFVDAETGGAFGSDPIWIGWDSKDMAVLRD